MLPEPVQPGVRRLAKSLARNRGPFPRPPSIPLPLPRPLKLSPELVAIMVRGRNEGQQEESKGIGRPNHAEGVGGGRHLSTGHASPACLLRPRAECADAIGSRLAF